MKIEARAKFDRDEVRVFDEVARWIAADFAPKMPEGAPFAAIVNGSSLDHKGINSLIEYIRSLRDAIKKDREYWQSTPIPVSEWIVRPETVRDALIGSRGHAGEQCETCIRILSDARKKLPKYPTEEDDEF